MREQKCFFQVCRSSKSDFNANRAAQEKRTTAPSTWQQIIIMIITTTRNPLSIRLLGNPPVNSGWNRSESVLLQIILRSVLCHVRVNHRQTPLRLQTDYLPAIVSVSAAARISAHDNVRYHIRSPGRLIYAVLANAIRVTWSVGFEGLLLPHVDMISTRHCFH